MHPWVTDKGIQPGCYQLVADTGGNICLAEREINKQGIYQQEEGN